jgi:hypothetical protein
VCFSFIVQVVLVVGRIYIYVSDLHMA